MSEFGYIAYVRLPEWAKAQATAAFARGERYFYVTRRGGITIVREASR